MQKGLLLCFLAGFSLLAGAQTLIPKDSAVQITDVIIAVEADNFSATTRVEMELFNSNSKMLDGEVAFSLANGQTITGFQLDINGKMRDGVVVEKQKARVAYENIVRRKVDPGLLEMTGANRYRIRVYPVPANGKRRVTFTVQQLLAPNGGRLDYLFPLDFSVFPHKLQADISVAGEVAPFASQGLLVGQPFKLQTQRYRCAYETQRPMPSAMLAFSLPLAQRTSVCAADNDCSTAFFARVTPDSLHLPIRALSTLTVFWDVSASASKRNLQRELHFLERYLQLHRPQQLRVLTFAIEPVENKTFVHPASNFPSVRSFLENQKPDGGTRLNRLRCADYPADEYLLFSDGQNSFGEGGVVSNGKPVFCIQSTISANTALLKQMASATAGKAISLTASTSEQAVETMREAEWNLVIDSVEQRRTELQVRKVGEAFFIAGNTAKRNDTIWLDFVYAIHRQRVALVPGAPDCKASSVADAAVMLRAQNLWEKDGEAAFDFATEHRLVSASTSLIVLDALEDYHQYSINPPADLLEEFKKRYPLQPDKKVEKKKDEEVLVYRNLQKAVNECNQKLRWWDPQLSQLVVKSPEQKRKDAIVAASINAQTFENRPSPNNSMGFKSNSLSEVVVVGYSTARQREMGGAVSSVSGSQLSGVSTVQQALAGRAAGLQVSASQPGASTSVQLRGLASIRGGGEPLYVIDGVRTDAATAMSMSTFDIENVSVLKDASSATLYGSGAANGVIVITTKRGRFLPKASRQEDEDEENTCVDSLGDVPSTLQYEAYLQLRQRTNEEPAFYFDMADYFFCQKKAKQALRIISNLTELRSENHQLLRTTAYVLEEWGFYADAVELYKAVLRIKEEEPQSYRDLALAHAMNGNRSEAVRLLYVVLTKDWGLYETRYQGLREIMMTELNALMTGQKAEAFGVEKDALQPVPVDLRVVVDWNKDETDIDLHVVEPNGDVCSYSHRTTKGGGRLTNDFTQGYGPEEYEIKRAVKGRYKIKIDYYGDRYQKQQVPSFVKLSIFRNYGKPNQTVFVKTIKLEGGERMIDLAEIKF